MKHRPWQVAKSMVYMMLWTPIFLQAQTVEEKIVGTEAMQLGVSEGEDFVRQINAALLRQREYLSKLSEKAAALPHNAEELEFKNLLAEVRATREAIGGLEAKWRNAVVAESKQDEEGYALWDQEETTLTQLIMEYGALDFLYIVPPEMATLKLNIHSGIPIPRESWGDMLEILLNHSGIGVKKLNAYARQLYIFKQDLSAVQLVTAKPDPLFLAPSNARVFYVFSPPVEQLKSITQFFERFSDNRQTFVYQVGGKIALVAARDDVLRLIELYQTVWQDAQGKVTKVVAVSKINVKEMEKILQGFFGDAIDKLGRPSYGQPQQESLSIFALGSGNALVLIGSQEVVDRAEKIIHTTEEQLLDPSEITVYLYTCRHSDPADLAKVLDKVYNSLLIIAPEPSKELEVNYQTKGIGPNTPDGYQPTPPLMIGPKPLNSGTVSQLEVEQGSDHFIPDPKTGTLLMVVRRDALVKIKELLRQLDVPKKMVQIEVLLFEKTLHTQNNFGLNLLKLGGDQNHMEYDGLFAPSGKGVLQFLFSGERSKHFPAFDITYSFLMTQEDVQLNAAPSVITVNQTPATISIQEEISINNGAAPIDTNKGIAFEKSFSRAQYGITIMLTPIIHAPENQGEQDERPGFITLQTNITFDTTKPHIDDRPLVERRHIENEVRVIDGQTVILGGLRRRTTHDNQDQIPFLGEIPFFGRLFGSTRLVDHNTEMFFFITPRIVLDSREQMEQMRKEELKKRPGDLPEFLSKVIEAREKERRKFFTNSLRVFLAGQP
ncbi:MAG: type II secretion system protein GspD [Simkania sp.]|nr:type II secretion system protein GspD [Simkania sp.]